MTVSSLTTATSSSNSGTITTASISPAANSLLIVWIACVGNPGAVLSGVTGLSLTWVNQVSGLSATGGCLDCWTAVTGSSPGSGTLTLSGVAVSTDTCWDVDQVTGVNQTTPVVTAHTTTNAPGVAGTALSETLPAAAAGNINLVCGIILGVTSQSLAAGASWTLITDQNGLAANGPVIGTEYSAAGGNTAAAMTGHTSEKWAIAGLEVALAATGVTSTGSFTLAPLAFSASGTVTAVVTSTGSFSLASLKLAATGTVSAFATVPGGLLQVMPGPTWLALYKPGLPKPRPLSPPSPLNPAVSAGSFVLAPLKFSAAGTEIVGLYIFTGHYSVSYPDYVDAATFRMLSCSPGNSYGMYVVSFRAGLTDPPPDGRWKGETGLGDEVIFVRSYDKALAIARALNAELQAVNAAASYPQVSGGTPVPQPEPGPPSQASVTTAGARSLNAELQARMAKGLPVAADTERAQVGREG